MQIVTELSQPGNEAPPKPCNTCGIPQPLTSYHRHPSSPDGHAHKCKKCTQAYCKANSEKRSARAKQWNAENPDRFKANVERHLEQRGTEIRVRLKSEYQEKRKDPNFRSSENAKLAEWRDRGGREKVAACSLRYSRRKRLNGGELTKGQWQALIERYGSKCLCCGAAGVLHADHIIPVSKGGTNDISNRQPLCASCNSSKRDSVIDYRPDVSCLVPK